MERIYLDYSASTPVAPEVRDAMELYWSEHFGNPSSIHFFGQQAQAAIDRSREFIAKELNIDFREVIFTSSATEANNLIIKGVTSNKRQETKEKKRIIVSAIEHESILEPAKELGARPSPLRRQSYGASATEASAGKEGIEVVYLPVSKDGFVDLEELRKALNENTILVSIIFASNEIGTIQPIGEIGRIIKETRNKRQGVRYPLFHTDAVQAFQFLKLDLQDLGVDALTISSHKLYGPKGAALLALRNEWLGELKPLFRGGNQEFGLRSGTENVAAIVGFAKAVELISGSRGEEAKRIEKLRNYFWQKLQAARSKLELNGTLHNRLPNNLNIYFPGQDSPDLLVKFDQAGIAVSAGSACSVKALEPSYVITALGFGEERSRSSLRFTLGRPTTKGEIDVALERITKLI